MKRKKKQQQRKIPESNVDYKRVPRTRPTTHNDNTNQTNQYKSNTQIRFVVANIEIALNAYFLESRIFELRH